VPDERARDAVEHEAPQALDKSRKNSVPTAGALRVVDVFQAALDVSRHAARGLEQAEYIVHEVLRWKDVSLG
jgi:hypothetical protein